MADSLGTSREDKGFANGPRGTSCISRGQENTNPICFTFITSQISDLAQIQLKHRYTELKKCMDVFSVTCGRRWVGKKEKNSFYFDTQLPQVKKTLFSQQWLYRQIDSTEDPASNQPSFPGCDKGLSGKTLLFQHYRLCKICQ